ncbi:hypothetical protein R3P38DRAFT_2767739 [Favolaschia claudopus]|uniref:Uncharacterized protein n=1 Tax=Favolaschia claudopus TaxID=2862362 RepID=A0AAW0CS74_9AGAR
MPCATWQHDRLAEPGKRPNALPITAEAFADFEVAWDLAIELDQHGTHYIPKQHPSHSTTATWRSLANKVPLILDSPSDVTALLSITSGSAETRKRGRSLRSLF